MLRIGIIGSESSHAMQFAKHFNLPDPETGMFRHAGIRVTSIMGDPETAERTAGQTGICCIPQTFEEMANQVDAIMITSRRGSEHLEQALPFIERGMPLFIDKPFTSDVQQAHKFMRAIELSACPVHGGSGCKYSRDVQQIKARVKQLTVERKLMTASIDFAIMLDSLYDGFWFYASHLVEICLEIFGTDIQTVQATKTEKNLVATLKYPEYIVSLHFVHELWNNSCILITNDGAEQIRFGISDALEEEAERFAGLLTGGSRSLTYAELVNPILLIDAILQAESQGQAIEFPLGAL